MDKARKLRHYQRKEYGETVAFPVEIVGRDGVIRRYSFEASVRLYMRRIASAAVRYDDQAVVHAEIHHCRQRIGQLRKSYFQRYGWSAFDDGPVDSPEYSGEMVAFLRRFYGAKDRLGDLSVSWVERASSHHLFFIEGGVAEEKWLLYLFCFDQPEGASEREEFFRLLRLLQSATGEDAERLVAFHHTADVGLVMTGVGDTAKVVSLDAMDGDPPLLVDNAGPKTDAYRAGLRNLAVGDLAGAMEWFQLSMQVRPWFRKAYVAHAVVADRKQLYKEAEVATRMGLHYFANDAVLHYHHGLAFFRQGRKEMARDSLSKALVLRPAIYPARYLLGLIDLMEGRFLSASRHLGQAAQLPHPTSKGDSGHLREIRGWLRTYAVCLVAMPNIIKPLLFLWLRCQTI